MAIQTFFHGMVERLVNIRQLGRISAVASFLTEEKARLIPWCNPWLIYGNKIDYRVSTMDQYSKGLCSHLKRINPGNDLSHRIRHICKENAGDILKKHVSTEYTNPPEYAISEDPEIAEEWACPP